MSSKLAALVAFIVASCSFEPAYAANIRLQGDVTGYNNANTVSSVGGSTAAQVHTSQQLTAAAASADNTGNTLVKRSAGGFTAGAVTIDDLTLSSALSIGNGGTGASSKTAAFDALSPMTTLGDLEYHDGTHVVRLAPNTALPRKFLMQKGDGVNSVVNFQWDTLQAGDIPVGAGVGWALNGNGATNPATDFLGTVDAIDFVIATNSTERFKFLSGGGLTASTSITPGTDNTYSLGTTASRWKDLWIKGTATFDSALVLTEIATPANPAAGLDKCYVKADHKFYCLQSGGAESLIGPLAAGAGTVTSVDLSMPAEFTVSNNPVTTSGTLTVTKANQNANLVYAGPSSGAAAQPTFRSLVAADIPSPMTTFGDLLYEDATPAPARLAGNVTTTKRFLTQTGTGAASAAPTWGGINAADVPNLDFSKITTGVVPIAQGGTNNTTFTDKSVIFYDSGAGKLSEDNANLNYNSATKKLTLGTDLVFNNPAATGATISGVAADGWLDLYGGTGGSGHLFIYSNLAGGGDAGSVQAALGGVVSTFDVFEHTLTTSLFQVADTGNVTINGDLTLAQKTTPAAPSAGYNKCYAKADDKFYCENSAGVETLIGPSAGGGGSVMSVLTKSGNYTILAADFSTSGTLEVKCNCTTACTLTLPAATNAGYLLKVKNIGTAACTVSRAGADTVDDDTFFTLVNHNDGFSFVADGGTQWSVY